MKIQPRKDKKGYVTLYYAPLGSREVRQAGFLKADGSSKILRKTVDEEHHRIIIEIDEAQEESK